MPGHGGFCWIKNGTPLLAVVGVPVALVIVFNFVTLIWTAISIYKVRKVRSLNSRKKVVIRNYTFYPKANYICAVSVLTGAHRSRSAILINFKLSLDLMRVVLGNFTELFL